MQINFAHLCDYASISKEGKLSVMGIFSRINGASLPLTHPQAYLAWELELSALELNRPFKFEIRCMGPDGEPVFNAELQGKLGMRDGQHVKPGDRPRVPQLMVISNLEFARKGDHHIGLYIDGSLKHEVPFEVHIEKALEQDA